MAMKEQPKMVHRSMQGKELDMNKLINQNELTVAVGNVRVNARGDELGPGGKIIRRREEVLQQAEGSIPGQNSVREQAVRPAQSAGRSVSKKVVPEDKAEASE